MTTKTLQEQILALELPKPAGFADFHVSAVFDCRIGEPCYTEHQVCAILKAAADLAAGQSSAKVSEGDDHDLREAMAWFRKAAWERDGDEIYKAQKVLFDLCRSAAPAIQQPQDDHAKPDNPLFLALAKKGG